MRVLNGYEPASVLGFFEDICNIPHISYHEKELSDYCVAFAKERGLYYEQDELGNVIQEAVPPTTTVQMQTQQKVEEKYEYESFVKFWMPFNGGIGMHDASWRGSFGGDIYKYSGSHGCINMPPKKMPKFYNMIEIGTPVAVHY